MSPALSRRHQAVVWKLSLAIGNHINEHPCEAYGAPFDVRLPDDNGCLGAPDLVVEVLSPGNTSRELNFKYKIYEESGVREYWVVYPDYEHVAVFLLDDSGKFVGQEPKTSGEVLTSFIFPDLSVNLSDIFA